MDSTAPAPPPNRHHAIDWLRGAVMVLMTIDHVREYSEGPGRAPVGDPMDLTLVTPFLFFLRWISHFCAPVFALLMGVSVALSGFHRTPAEQRTHLVQRGLVLLLLEFTIVNWAWTFNPLWHRYFFQVIAALGFAMIALGLTAGWPSRTVLAVGLVIVAGHDAFDWVQFQPGTIAHYLWSILHQKNVLPLMGGFEFRTTYPVLPVIGVAFCGYGLGGWFREPASAANRRKLLLVGFACCVLFLALRLSNVYGDMSRFTPGSNLTQTLMSLGNATKYPLSLHFVLMTIGPSLILLGILQGPLSEGPRWLNLLGRTPMFYYVAHLVGAHLFAWIAALFMGYGWTSLDVRTRYGGIPPGFGFPLWWTLPLSFALIAALLPACACYARLRASRRYRWTSYL